MKAQSLLTQLEREPIVYLGCTWSEIIGSLQRGLLIGVVLAFISGFVAALLLPGALVLVSFMLTLVISSGFLTYRKLIKINALRAGKPLFYELHKQSYKTSKFIRPPKLYQRERNLNAAKTEK